jgi:hypothetical protein
MEISLRAPVVTPPPSARPPGGTLTPDEVLALHDELLAYLPRSPRTSAARSSGTGR